MDTHYFKTIWKSKYNRPIMNYLVKGASYDATKPAWDIVRECLARGDTDRNIVIAVLSRTIIQHDKSRVNERVRGLHSILEPNFKPSVYLDYGCGDGQITKHIAQSFGITTENAYGVDILETCSTDINYANPHEIPSGVVDLVTAFVSMHHILDINTAISHIYRVLKPGGIFVIREHDFDGTALMFAYLQLIHVIACVKKSDNLDYIKYYSAIELRNIICAKGFVFNGTNTYNGNNPQGLYYATFRKK